MHQKSSLFFRFSVRSGDRHRAVCSVGFDRSVALRELVLNLVLETDVFPRVVNDLALYSNRFSDHFVHSAQNFGMTLCRQFPFAAKSEEGQHSPSPAKRKRPKLDCGDERGVPLNPCERCFLPSHPGTMPSAVMARDTRWSLWYIMS